MKNTINEISPLLKSDCFYVVERTKNGFSYPIHRHSEFELNFIEGASGVKRVVGDSIEVIQDYDLVLIGSENLEHAWLQGDCKSSSIREITIQFSGDIFSDTLLMRTQFDSIRSMFEKSKQGVVFPISAIIKIYPILDKLTSLSGFEQFMAILKLFYELSICTGTETLSNSTFTKIEIKSDSRRVAKIDRYINEHYRETIRLNTLAELIGMTPPAFSRFFKLRTGTNLSDYIANIRLGVAARYLTHTTMSISEICYECGFNNISNFNRIFKKRKKLTPKEFREIYTKQ